jgi:hypothetical protein
MSLELDNPASLSRAGIAGGSLPYIGAADHELVVDRVNILHLSVRPCQSRLVKVSAGPAILIGHLLGISQHFRDWMQLFYVL